MKSGSNSSRHVCKMLVRFSSKAFSHSMRSDGVNPLASFVALSIASSVALMVDGTGSVLETALMGKSDMDVFLFPIVALLVLFFFGS